MVPAPPPHLTPVEREAWIQARTRGAEYARGLGNIVTDDMRDAVVEAWDGDLVTHEADREQRLIVREQIRTETAAAIAEGQGPRKLASRLGNLTGDWSRNWLRIAKTELQGAYNDGVVIDAIRTFGPGALKLIQEVIHTQPIRFRFMCTSCHQEQADWQNGQHVQPPYPGPQSILHLTTLSTPTW